ncbi:ribonuclease H1 small subunit [Ophiobolus disseminans]|uniref:Ribonuclease H1 small subunit n=1 Tax=Ophiobolus disseminans TaxID=1469910 RepID=A0A6A7A9W4_9PLEO|nr:ribonuclease H1 small subunit [Ophiobolus disseminans]
MLALHPTHPQKCTPNLLPARVHHSGPINDAPRYWKPETDEKGTQHVYFRGRHFHGSVLQVPEGYVGAVVNVTDKCLPTTQTQNPAQPRDSAEDEEEEEEEQDEEAQETVKIAEIVGEFDGLVVWEHGGKVDEGRDAYVRGVGEWVGWAESMHVDGDGEGEEDEATNKA